MIGRAVAALRTSILLRWRRRGCSTSVVPTGPNAPANQWDKTGSRGGPARGANPNVRVWAHPLAKRRGWHLPSTAQITTCH